MERLFLAEARRFFPLYRARNNALSQVVPSYEHDTVANKAEKKFWNQCSTRLAMTPTEAKS